LTDTTRHLDISDLTGMPKLELFLAAVCAVVAQLDRATVF